MVKISPLIIALLLSTGCANLIIKKDDSGLEKTGKVVTRTALMPVTFFTSEARIALEKDAIETKKYLSELDDKFHKGEITEAEYTMKYKLAAMEHQSKRQNVANAYAAMGNSFKKNNQTYTARPDGLGNYTITEY